jgi:adenine-specific DNA-methyltransferase
MQNSEIQTKKNSFPSTRYQGSKLKILDWLWDSISNIEFNTVLDLFSGTSSVGYFLKCKGKQITSNDYMLFNKIIADALVCNSDTTITDSEILSLTSDIDIGTDSGFIEREYAGKFYLDNENRWLDNVTKRIHLMPDGYKKSLAFFALYQACIIKRPYGLFHRANLSMRTSNIKRGFGNKITWDKPFSYHFANFINKANRAVFSNGKSHNSIHGDFLDVKGDFDLVYMDPPYINSSGIGVDYLDFYSFLEGLTEYPVWSEKIDNKYKHKPYVRTNNPWNKKDKILSAFDAALERYKKSTILISYRCNGIPSVEQIIKLLKKHNRKNITMHERVYNYALSKEASKEMLFISYSNL